MRTPYPSDLTEEQWQTARELLPKQAERGRRRDADLREVLNGINYRWKTGCPWRMLPHDLPAWETVYFYFNSWRRAGLLTDLREIVLRRRRSSRPKKSRTYW